MQQHWTLDELVRRAAEALAAQHVRAPNGRVTPLPDRRVVRWYATIGLVDRPAAYRGRTALYGPRHLLQVVAVKRRQAQGRSLAEIQTELAGATDSTLREVARIAEDAAPLAPGSDGAAPAHPAAARTRFWATALEPGPAPDPPAPRPPASRLPVPLTSASSPEDELDDQSDDQPVETSGETSGEMEVSYAIFLHPGARLMLRVRPGTGDLTEIRAAARPLLDLLSQRGLLSEGD